MKSSHTDLTPRKMEGIWFYFGLSVKPIAIPSNTACREMARTTRKPLRAAWGTGAALKQTS